MMPITDVYHVQRPVKKLCDGMPRRALKRDTNGMGSKKYVQQL